MNRYQTRVLADGATVYWPLDDVGAPTVARDLRGSNPLTIGAGVQVGAQRITNEGRAFEFPNAANVLLSNSSPSSALTPAANQTLEFWMDLTASSGGGVVLFNRYVDANNRIISRYFTTGLIRTEWLVGGVATRGAHAAGTLGSNRHHIVAAYNGSAIALYVDGVSISPIGADPNTTPTTALQIYEASSSNAMRLSNIAFYPFAMSQGMAISHYNAGTKSQFRFRLRTASPRHRLL